LTTATLASFLLLGVAASAAPAPETPAPPARTAAPPAVLRVEGVPGRDPIISVNLPRGSAGRAINLIAERAGWSLTASGEGLSDVVSLRVKDRPATEVLTILLEAAGLRAIFEEGTGRSTTLEVRAADPRHCAGTTARHARPRARVLLKPRRTSSST
jgi:hypothetical protein